MSIPWPGGPQQSVNQPDPSTQVAQGLTAMSRQLQGLNQALTAQTQMIQRSLNASSRYQMGGGQGGGAGGGGGVNTPQMNPQIVANAQAMGQSLSGPGMTQQSVLGAGSSASNLQAYLAQQIGQWIAGVPLYGSQGGNQGSQQSPSAPQGQQGQQQGQQPGPVPPQGGLAGALFGTGQGGSQSPGAARGTMILQNLGAQVAASGGGPGTIASAARSIPGVGTVMDAASSAANFYQGQREAGRMYQNVEGGSNLDAQTERLHALTYEASMWGRMPSGATAQAFGAVTQMGFNQAASNEGGEQQNRQSALNFIYSNYNQTGMSVNESAQVLGAASQSPVVNLQQLSKALNDLSTAAGQAGTNAETARQQFTSYFSTVLGQGAGNGATGVAQGVAGMQAAGGKQMSSVNFSGLLSSSNQYLLSGQSGLSVPQLQQIQRNSPSQYNQLLAGQSLSELTSSGLMTPQMQQGMQQMIQQAGGTAALKANPDLYSSIVSQFLNKYQVSGNINENVWTGYINSLTGSNMTNAQAMQYIVQQMAGVNEASSNSAITSSTGASVSASSLGSAPTGKGGLAVGTGSNLAEQIATLGAEGHGSSWQQVLQGDNSSAAAPYLAAEQKSGQRNPVLESLIQNTSSGDQVAVQTATGTRVMSMADAMKYYPQELQAGSVQFYGASGQALGNTSALTGGLVNAGASTAGEVKQKAGSTLGTTLSAYQKAHPAPPSGGAISGIFSLTAEAAQLLKLLPSTSNQAAATSTVPANTYATQASR
jgi:hypothetical protein